MRIALYVHGNNDEISKTVVHKKNTTYEKHYTPQKKGVFYASGCNTLQELIFSWRRWTPARRREMEQTFGIKPKSMEHEDVKATAHMTEDEEWDFIKKKYIPELVVVGGNDDDVQQRGDGGGKSSR